MKNLIKKNKLLILDLFNEDKLELNLVTGKDGLRTSLKKGGFNRPGLCLAGWYENFIENEIQIFGRNELGYLQSLESARREKSVKDFFNHNMSMIVVSDSCEPPEVLIKNCEKHKIPLFKTRHKTADFIKKILPFLETKLNPRHIFHGELVEVYGVGIMIVGDSGVGKSECALELVKRNHILVADDIVEVYMNSNNEIIGEGSEIIKYHLEIRGIGIINIKTLFGIGAIKDKVNIDLIVEMEHWKEGKEYDRIGLKETTTNVLGIDVAQLCIPVKVGRNLASVIEVAAMNYRSKKMGFYSVENFNKRLISWIQGKEF